jgi:predicted acylesterase/phospholipase RssA
MKIQKNIFNSNESQPDSSESHPDSSESQPDSSESQPDSSESHPDSSESQPDSNESQPDSSESQPDSSESQPDSSEEKITIKPKSGDFDTLVLSGGSIHCITMLGSLQYSKDNYLLEKIKIFIGTSAGALCGYLLALGYDPIEIMVHLCTNQLLERMKHFNIVAMLNGSGATTFLHIQEQLEKMTINKIGRLLTLKELHTILGKTLICITHNMTTGNEEILSYETYPDMPCLIALRMTCNLPFIFEPFTYMGNLYVDGGFSNNFPIDIGDIKGEKIFGIVLHDIKNNFETNPNNIIEYIYQLLSIPVLQRASIKIKNASDKCTILTLIPDKTFFFNFNLDTHTKLEMFSSGYIQMKNYWNK